MPESSQPSAAWSTLAAELYQTVTTSLTDQLAQSLMTPLADDCLLRVSGDQWRSFLQGQLTCDVSKADPSQALAGAFCTPKGRMIANLVLICAADDSHAWLRVPRDVAPLLRDTLQKYAVFSKVELTLEEELCGLGIQLLPQSRQPEPLTAAQAGSQLSCWHTPDTLIVQRDEAGCRFEIWCSATQASTLWATLRDELLPAVPASWQLLDIRAGLGQVVAATSELFLPQMLNLDLLDAVSFRKGCYTGQEVVARLHYRGKSKRRMHRIAGQLSTDSSPPQPGQRLLDQQGRSQGEVVMAVATEPARFEGLAVLAESHLEESLFLLEGGPAVELLPLPYAITTADHQ